MIYKDVFWCPEHGHLFEFWPYELPEQGKMDYCNYCGKPMQYLGQITYVPEDDIWVAKFYKRLVSPHITLGSHYDETSGVYFYSCRPQSWDVVQTEGLVDYHTGESK